MKLLSFLKNEYFWLGLILFFGFLVRIYKIDAPIADWHSWRQADTAAVTRNFIKEGFNPFFPKYDDMSGVSEHPVVNPARFRFVEFPLYNIFTYPLYLIYGVDEKLHRLVTILFSLGSSVFLYFIVKKYSDKLIAFTSFFTFTFLPFNVFFSRVILPDPVLVFFALGMIYFVGNWIEIGKRANLVLGFLFTVISFLLKPWAIFFFLPLLYLIYCKKNKFFTFKFLLLTFLALIPFLFWRLWILQQPEGIPASSWLVNSDAIRFRPAFFWWIISNRLGTEILTAGGMGLFLLGLITKPKNGNYFLHIWLFCSFLFITIFATGNVRHNYYQIYLIPAISIFFSIGFMQLMQGNKYFLARIWTIPLGLLLFVLTFYFGVKQISGFYQINNPVIVQAGIEADKSLPKNAIVVAPYNGDTAFLYQTNRSGFAFIPLPITELIADFGVTSYVSTTMDVKTKWIMKYFNVLKQGDNFVIVDLTTLTKKLDFKLDPEP